MTMWVNLAWTQFGSTWGYPNFHQLGVIPIQGNFVWYKFGSTWGDPNLGQLVSYWITVQMSDRPLRSCLYMKFVVPELDTSWQLNNHRVCLIHHLSIRVSLQEGTTLTFYAISRNLLTTCFTYHTLNRVRDQMAGSQSAVGWPIKQCICSRSTF